MNRTAGVAHVRRARENNRPIVPALMSNLGEVLHNYLPAQMFFQGHVTAEDASCISFFASNEMINRLNTATEFHLSGTVEVIMNLIKNNGK